HFAASHRYNRRTSRCKPIVALVAGPACPCLLEYAAKLLALTLSTFPQIPMTTACIARCAATALFAALSQTALAQQAPPPPPTSANVVQQRTPGLTPELAEVARLMREGQYAPARAKLDSVLATDAKNPQARFLKGVVQTDEAETDAAIATFQALTEDYPE